MALTGISRTWRLAPSLAQISFYVERIVGPPAAILLENILGVAIALQLVRWRDGFYYCELNRGKLHYFTRKKFLLPAVERAKFLSVLQTIPEANAVLVKIGAPAC